MLKNKFHKYSIIAVIFLTVLNLCNSIFLKQQLVILKENQILYIYSSLAQIIGSLLGLIIAGYSIIDNKIRIKGEEDSTVTDYTEELRCEYFSSLILIIIFSVIDILFCLVVLSIYNDYSYNVLLIFLNETIIIFAFIMMFTIRFVYYLNPLKLRQKGSDEKEEIERDYYKSTMEQNNKFSPFVTYYNLLEKLIKTYACELIDNLDNVYKMQIYEALDILLQREIINREIYNRINELRRYRNALVHSFDTDKAVESSIFSDLEQIYTKLKNVYDNRESTNLYNESKKELFKYSHEIGYGNIENSILKYLSTQTASLKEIADYLGITHTLVARKLQNLQRLDLIEKIDSNSRVKWRRK